MKLNFITLYRDPSSTLGAVIGGGSSLLGDIFNLFGQSKANREQEAYNTNVMNQQRQWSLEDVATQNAYNSPVQQMARLNQAGLNPNLVYGEGIQAAGNADQPRSVPSASFSPQNTLSAFQNLGGQTMAALDTGYNLPNKAQSLNNMKAEETNKIADTYIKKLQGNQLSTEPGASGGDDLRSDVRSKKLQLLNDQENTAANNASIQGVKAFVENATQGAQVTQGVQAGLQAAIRTMADGAAKDNLIKIGENLDKDKELKKLDIQQQTFDTDPKNPIYSQLVTKILHAIIAHVSSK